MPRSGLESPGVLAIASKVDSRQLSLRITMAPLWRMAGGRAIPDHPDLPTTRQARFVATFFFCLTTKGKALDSPEIEPGTWPLPPNVPGSQIRAIRHPMVRRQSVFLNAAAGRYWSFLNNRQENCFFLTTHRNRRVFSCLRFNMSEQLPRSISMNVATQQNVAPAVSEHFSAIERSFEALSHHGFLCYSVLADQKKLKTYKIQRDPAIDDGRVHLVDDLSARTQPVVGTDFGAEVTTIRRGSEKVRSLARTMRSISMQSASPLAAFQAINVMAKLVLHELNAIDEAVEDLDN